MTGSIGNLVPMGGAWGQETAQPAGLQQWLYPVTQLVGGVIEASQDPFRQVGVLEAQLADAKMRGAPLTTIRELEAKLAAAQRKVQGEVEWEQTQRQVATLTKLGAATGILVGLAVAFFVVTRALR